MGIKCFRTLIIGAGISVPHRLYKVQGSEHFEHYDTVSTNSKDFDGQNVLIIGRGNSGMETELPYMVAQHMFIF